MSNGNQRVRVALDAMGGDHGPAMVVPAALEMLAERPNLELILVGQQEVIQSFLGDSKGDFHPRLQIIDAREVVAMDEPPAEALRKKKDSSLRVAINQVKAAAADACVSAGNTGALMATAKFVLKTLPGIDRPAIMSVMPTVDGHAHMLDLGANTDCSSENLFQFAIMGSVVASEVENIPEPRIGLLNIGSEEIKGNDTIRQAAAMIGESRLNYIGFVEANDIPQKKADVVVCDGFSGNIALKAMEGTALFVRHLMRKQFKRSLYGRLAAVLSYPVLSSLGREMDPRRYNGASLVGLNGIVVKSHGGADVVAFKQAIKTAIIEVEKSVPEKIHTLLAELEH